MLKHKVVVVTGGNKGIGAGIALSAAKSGADVVIQYHSDTGGADSICEEIQSFGKKAYAIQADFTKELDVEELIKKVIGVFGSVDVLINCAAAYKTHSFLELTTEDFSWMHQVNSLAPMRLIQSFAKYCIGHEKSGSVVNVSSISGSMPSVNSTLNSCSKASLNMLTRSAALELAKHNIRVNAIMPGLVDTESNADFKTHDQAGWSKAIDEIPLKKIGMPSDCGELAVFLASDQSSWITGAIIPVDGGMTISWRN